MKLKLKRRNKNYNLTKDYLICFSFFYFNSTFNFYHFFSKLREFDKFIIKLHHSYKNSATMHVRSHSQTTYMTLYPLT